MGKNILITGSSRGIGRETAIYIAKNNSDVEIVLHCNKNISKAGEVKKEIELLEMLLKERNIKFAFLDGFLKGSDGSLDLANKVLETLDTSNRELKLLYNKNAGIKEKIDTIAKKIYGAKEVEYSELALAHLDEIAKLEKDDYVICMAKTQSSLSDDASLLNVPRDFTLHVKDMYLSNGAKFIVVMCGNILTMPGLPKVPRAVDFK